MIVMVQGTHRSQNCSAHTFAMCGAMSALKLNKKTLMLQLTPAGSTDAEQLLIGKALNETTINTTSQIEVYRIDDRGIDALMRRATSSKLGKEHFSSSCRALMEKSENLLDIAAVTGKEDFEATLDAKEISIILKYAAEVYDNIFVLLDGRDSAKMKEILQMADSYITCISQSPQKETWNIKEDAREIKVITKYDSFSTFTTNYLKKLYKTTSLFPLPYNTAYRDAYIRGFLLDYILGNINDKPEDDNYGFMHAVETIALAVLGKDVKENDITLVEPNTLPKRVSKRTLQPVEEFSTRKVEKKVGLFKKKKMETVVLGHEPEDYLEEDYLEEDYMEETLEEELEQYLDEEEIQEEIVEVPPVKEIKVSNSLAKQKAAKEEISEIEQVKESTKKVSSRKTSSKKMPVVEIKQEISPTKPKVLRSPNAEPSSDTWKCPECDCENTGKYCEECGTKKPEVKKEWYCPECGTKNTRKFCSSCGYKH